MAPPLEIERKFLVDPKRMPKLADGQRITQAYLFVEPDKSLRLRVLDGRAMITLKVRCTDITREEYEYEVPLEEAKELLNHRSPGEMIEKVRYSLNFADNLWVVDVFEGPNKGLFMAEIELESPDQPFEAPPWVTKEVTGEPPFKNEILYQKPYKSWKNTSK